MLQTKVISYNLKDRGRKYRGKDRDFDIPAIVKAINSPECQERVKKGDMLGYYGHWPRIKFGMYPCEGGLQQGKATIIEPAIRTIMLKAYSDGTVEHRAEFLDTDAGKLAEKLFRDKVGGFSSAIDQGRPEFYGFDYVLEPNYSTNRGWALDSVQGMPPDEVEAAIYGEQIRGVMVLLDRVTAERDRANEVIEHLREENDELIAKQLKAETITDSDVIEIHRSRCSFDAVARMEEDARLFKSIKRLPQFEKPKEEQLQDENPLRDNGFYNSILSQYKQ